DPARPGDRRPRDRRPTAGARRPGPRGPQRRGRHRDHRRDPARGRDVRRDPGCPARRRRGLPHPRSGGAPVSAPALPTRRDVETTAARLAEVLAPTPLRRNARLSTATGWDVWLKREDLQPVRSYKARGALAMLAALDDEARAAGVTCASAGNHAQGLAFACARARVRARIFLPRTTPRQKRERVAVLGGDWVEVVLTGETYDDAAAAAAAYAAASSATVVPAF